MEIMSCIKYGLLNDNVITYKYPIPRIDGFSIVLVAWLFLARMTYSLGIIMVLLKINTDKELHFNLDIDYMNTSTTT